MFSSNNICPTLSRFTSFFSVWNEETKGAQFFDARNSENNYNIVREEDNHHVLILCVSRYINCMQDLKMLYFINIQRFLAFIHVARQDLIYLINHTENCGTGL